MARSSECTDSYAKKVLDAADIAREGYFATDAGRSDVSSFLANRASVVS
jgi:hypothetical protein